MTEEERKVFREMNQHIQELHRQLFLDCDYIRNTIRGRKTRFDESKVSKEAKEKALGWVKRLHPNHPIT